VRIHADGRAAEAAEEERARAFAAGNDIVFAAGQFAPGTPAGDELLAHELAHTIQQEGIAEPIAQHQPREPQKKETKGIGKAPPEEPFTVEGGKGPEEEHFLFALDSAELPGDAAKKLQALLAPHKGSLIVDVHGYASKEGDPTYDLNLAAHRAAAVKRAILPLLPPGSQVELYAHGKTEAWGARGENRRAGIHVCESPSLGAPGFQLKPIVPPLSIGDQPTPAPERGGLGYANTDIDLGYRYRPTIPTLDPTKPIYDPFLLPAPVKPPGLLDWSALREPFTSRGLRLNDYEIGVVQDNWNRAYLWALGIGLSPDNASLAASKLTATAYDLQLGKDYPNFWDKIDQEDKRLGISKSPMIPIITPETLKFLGKQFFKIDIDPRF
jgi:outer membrane protein OmpA-like peptidoglycan-associated protein